MTKEQIREKADKFISTQASGMPKEMDYYANILTEFATKVTKELEKENEELKQYAKALEETDNTNILHCMKVNGKLYKAKKLIKEMLSILPKENIEGIYEITEEAEQFISEVEK